MITKNIFVFIKFQFKKRKRYTDSSKIADKVIPIKIVGEAILKLFNIISKNISQDQVIDNINKIKMKKIKEYIGDYDSNGQIEAYL